MPKEKGGDPTSLSTDALISLVDEPSTPKKNRGVPAVIASCWEWEEKADPTVVTVSCSEGKEGQMLIVEEERGLPMSLIPSLKRKGKDMDVGDRKDSCVVIHYVKLDKIQIS